VRRLEAMRRARAGVQRHPDGTWVIGPGHLERAEAYERRHARMHPVTVEILSALPLARQLATDGATWLDRDLVADAPAATRDAGFGHEVREALARRREWLVEQGLAREEQNRVVYRRDLLAVLRQRELTRVATQLSGEIGLAYAELQRGVRIEGVYRRRLYLASGRFALIEKSREFTLVPGGRCSSAISESRSKESSVATPSPGRSGVRGSARRYEPVSDLPFGEASSLLAGGVPASAAGRVGSGTAHSNSAACSARGSIQ